MGQAMTESAGFRRIRRTMALERRHRTPSRQIQRTVDIGTLDELHQGLLHPKRIARLDMWIPSARRESRSHLPRSLRRRCWSTLAGSFRLTVVTSTFMGVECVIATEAYVPLRLFLSLRHVWQEETGVGAGFALVVFGAYHRASYLLRSGWRNPTGRTERVFSHHDHKFEWTVGDSLSGATRWRANGDTQWRSARWARRRKSMSANQSLSTLTG